MISTVGDAITRALSSKGTPSRPPHGGSGRKEGKSKTPKTDGSSGKKKKRFVEGSPGKPGMGVDMSTSMAALAADLTEVNFVCTHPKGRPPPETDKTAPWNRGRLAQTWAPHGGWDEGKVAGPTTGTKCEEGSELEAIDVGSAEADPGEVFSVTVVGAFLVSWGQDGLHQKGKKYVIIVVRDDDPLADVAESLEELEAERPGVPSALETYIQSCEAEGSPGQPVREGHVSVSQVPAGRTKSIIRAAYFSWLFARPSPKASADRRASSAAESAVGSAAGSSDSSAASSARSMGSLCTVETPSPAKTVRNPKGLSTVQEAQGTKQGGTKASAAMGKRREGGDRGGSAEAWRIKGLELGEGKLEKKAGANGDSAAANGAAKANQTDKKDGQLDSDDFTIESLSAFMEEDASLDDSWLSASTPTSGFSSQSSWATERFKAQGSSSGLSEPAASMSRIEGSLLPFCLQDDDGDTNPTANADSGARKTPQGRRSAVAHGAVPRGAGAGFPTSQSVGCSRDVARLSKGDLIQGGSRGGTPTRGSTDCPPHLLQWRLAMAGALEQPASASNSTARQQAGGRMTPAGRGHHRRHSTTGTAWADGFLSESQAQRSSRAGNRAGSVPGGQGSFMAKLAARLELDPALFMEDHDDDEDTQCTVDSNGKMVTPTSRGNSCRQQMHGTSYRPEQSGGSRSVHALVTPGGASKGFSSQWGQSRADNSVYALVTPRNALHPTENKWGKPGAQRLHRRTSSVPSLPGLVQEEADGCQEEFLQRSSTVEGGSKRPISTGKAADVSRLILGSPRMHALAFYGTASRDGRGSDRGRSTISPLGEKGDISGGWGKHPGHFQAGQKTTTDTEEQNLLRQERGPRRTTSLTGQRSGGDASPSFVFSNRQSQAQQRPEQREPGGFGSPSFQAVDSNRAPKTPQTATGTGHRRSLSLLPLDDLHANRGSPTVNPMFGVPKPLPAQRRNCSPLEAWESGKWRRKEGGGGLMTSASGSLGQPAHMTPGNLVLPRVIVPQADVMPGRRVVRRSSSMTERTAGGSLMVFDFHEQEETTAAAVTSRPGTGGVQRSAFGSRQVNVAKSYEVDPVTKSGYLVPAVRTSSGEDSTPTRSKKNGARYATPPAVQPADGSMRQTPAWQSEHPTAAMSGFRGAQVPGGGGRGSCISGEQRVGATLHGEGGAGALLSAKQPSGPPINMRGPSLVERSVSQREGRRASSVPSERYVAQSYSSIREPGRGKYTGFLEEEASPEASQGNSLFQVVDSYFVPLKEEAQSEAPQGSGGNAGRRKVLPGRPGTGQGRQVKKADFRSPQTLPQGRAFRRAQSQRERRKPKEEEKGLVVCPGLRKDVRELERSDSEEEDKEEQVRKLLPFGAPGVEETQEEHTDEEFKRSSTVPS